MLGRKFGFSFSAKRALGVSALKGKVARATGIPTTRSGRQRKLGRLLWPLTPLALGKTKKKTVSVRDDSDYLDEQSYAIAKQNRGGGFFTFVRKVIGFCLIVIGLILGLASVVGWVTVKDQSERYILISLSALSLILLLVGIKWTKNPPRSYSWRDDPATDRQKSFARELGIRFSKKISKRELSDMIGEVTGE